MIRIGIICPSEIAERRFLPALEKNKNFKFVGLAISSKEERFGKSNVEPSIVDSVLNEEKNKANRIISKYGGILYDSYESIVSSKDIDAIYIPLPPGLHFYWAKKALEHDKHVLVEKPSTTSFEDSKELVALANSKKLALHENYMFVFHKQIDEIQKFVSDGVIGDIRLIRIDFGFPMRQLSDFRYKKELGGGALLDAGGYTLKLANILLGDTTKVVTAHLNNIDGFNVDFYGSATLVNDKGQTAQISFGMDNEYRCNLDIWGSKGSLFTDRILTAPNDFVPKLQIKNAGVIKTIELSKDDTFSSSIQFFYDCINDANTRSKGYNQILKQSELLYNFYENLK